MNPHGPILVPLDGSRNAENAVPVAAAVARLHGLPLRFIHVLDDSLRATADVDHARGLFSEYVEELAGRNNATLSEGSIEFGMGDAARVILASADSAAMIVIATHGRGGFRAALIGSVADKVVRSARIPVIAVPGTGRPVPFGQGPVLVAVDGSENGERALEAGRQLAKELGATVALVRAFQVPPPIGVEFAYYPPDFNETLEKAAFEYLDDVAHEGERKLVINGTAAPAIVRAAQDVDASIVVIASSGKSLPRRVALGSTTDRVLHSLRLPLLIVPPAETNGEGEE